MKKWLFFVLISILFFIGCTPADYYDSIVTEVYICQTKIGKIQQAKNDTELTLARKDTSIQLKKSIKKIEKIGDFRRNNELYKSAIELLEFYKNTLDNTPNLMNKKSTSFIEQEHRHLKKLSDSAVHFIKVFDLIVSKN